MGAAIRSPVREILLATILVLACTESAGPPATPVELCAGLVTDTDPHPMTPLARPAVGVAVTDPEFGTNIRRITDVGAGGVLKPMYSTVPAWNADESYLILYHTGDVSGRHELYDGRTYQFIKVLNIEPADLEQVYWHTANPNTLYYVNRTQQALIRYDVVAGTKQTLHTFTCTGDVTSGGDPMFTSWDSRKIGLTCRQSASQREVFAHDIGTGAEGPRLATTLDVAPQPGPGGQLFYFMGDVLDASMSLVRSLDLGSPQEHASLGALANGHDTYNAVSFGGNHIGALVVHDLTDASARVVVGPATGYPYPPSGTHVSAVAYRQPGWVFVSSVGATPDGQAVLNNELYIADANPGGVVCRVAHHRSWAQSGPQGYWAEPHVVPSPSGTRLLFGSDWGGANTVNAYVVELPSYQP